MKLIRTNKLKLKRLFIIGLLVIPFAGCNDNSQSSTGEKNVYLVNTNWNEGSIAEIPDSDGIDVDNFDIDHWSIQKFNFKNGSENKIQFCFVSESGNVIGSKISVIDGAGHKTVHYDFIPYFKE